MTDQNQNPEASTSEATARPVPTESRPSFRERLDRANALCTRYKDLVGVTDAALKVPIALAAIAIAVSQFNLQKSQTDIQRNALDIQREQTLLQGQQRTIQSKLAEIAYEREQPSWMFRIGFSDPAKSSGLQVLVSNEGEGVPHAAFEANAILVHTEFKGTGDARYCLQRITPLRSTGDSFGVTRAPRGPWGIVGLSGVDGYFGQSTELNQMRGQFGSFESVTPALFVAAQYNNRLGHQRVEGHFVSYSGSNRLEIEGAMRFKDLIRSNTVSGTPTLDRIRNGFLVTSEASQKVIRRCPLRQI